LKALGPLASSDSDRYSQEWVKALGPLAVAARDILALRTARENRARAGDYSERERTSPFQSARKPPRTAPHRPHASPASCGARFAALLIPRTVRIAASAVLRHARRRAPRWL